MIDTKKWQINNSTTIEPAIFNLLVDSCRTTEQNVCNCYKAIKQINPFEHDNAKKIALQEEIASKLQGKIARFLEVELYHISGMTMMTANQKEIFLYHVREMGAARDAIKKCVEIAKYYLSINSMVNTLSTYETNKINNNHSLQFQSPCTAIDFIKRHL